MLDIIEDYLETVNVFKGSDVSLGDLDYVDEATESVVAYLNSFTGVMKRISESYDATKINVDNIMQTLDDPEKIGLVKDILDKIG